MTLSTVDSTIQSLGNLLDSSQIVTTHESSDAKAYQAALTAEQLPPLVLPNTPDELQELLSWANQDKKTVLISGAATKLGWGNAIPATDCIISTRNLNQIIDHAEGDLTVTLQSGVTFQQLSDLLAPKGQMLPIDPTYAHQATLGGILATRDTGSLRQRYGGVRDLCLGISFVRADGQLAKGGGRVVKNVAGYDLMKLFTGSFGSLGVISELTLRLYPMQEASQTVLFAGETEAIATLTAKLLDSTLTPVSIDLLSQDLLQSLDITAPLGVAVRFQNLQESVTAQVNRLKDMGATLTAKVFEQEADQNFWPQLQSTLWDSKTETTAIAKMGLLPQSIPQNLAKIQSLGDQAGVKVQTKVLAGWGIGTLRLSGDALAVQSTLLAIRDQCEQSQCYLIVLEAS